MLLLLLCPADSAAESIRDVLEVQQKYWQSLQYAGKEVMYS